MCRVVGTAQVSATGVKGQRHLGVDGRAGYHWEKTLKSDRKPSSKDRLIMPGMKPPVSEHHVYSRYVTRDSCCYSIWIQP